MKQPSPHSPFRGAFAPFVTLVLSMIMALVPFAASAGPWSISEFQPNIKNGGRANTIAVNPANSNIIIVASESGGLFKSIDHGSHWTHLDGLPEYSTNSVAFVPANPNIVIATANSDFRAQNGGGIWRSTDGGTTWAHIPALPPATPGWRVSAWDISIAPDSGKIFVGNSYGLAVSSDQGATWTAASPFGAGDNRTYSVVAQAGNRVLVAGPGGVLRSTDGGTTWLTPTGLPTGGIVFDIHALSGSPSVADQAYLVTISSQLWYTQDAGDHWAQIASAPATTSGCGGIPFAKAVVASGAPALDLYFGNRCSLSKLHAPKIAASNSYDYSGSWTTTMLDHGDTRDLAFDSSNIPMLLGTDGGLHHTTDGGASWTFIGGGAAGYNALQITEVKGQWIDNTLNYDLYFGTQDNNLWTSGNTGASWGPGICCEGFFIEMQKHVATTADSQISFVSCGPCNNLKTGELFGGLGSWVDPPNSAFGDTPTIVGKSFHVQGVETSGSFAKGLAVTTNLGASWAQYATLPEDRVHNIPQLSSPPGGQPVLYQAIRTGYNAALGLEIDHLARIVKAASGYTGALTYPAMNNFGGLGINSTMFIPYRVYAVDPANSLHLIAPDVVNEKVMVTTDGGDNWSEIPGLASLVTNAGEFQFRDRIFPLVSAVSFSPDNPKMVAIGTMQNGIFLSSDGGVNWAKVPGSEKATYITSLEWRTPSDVIVSTYGRGLWRVQSPSAPLACPSSIYLANNATTPDGMTGNGGFLTYQFASSAPLGAGKACTYTRTDSPNWDPFIGRNLVAGELSATSSGSNSWQVALNGGGTKTVTCPANISIGPVAYYTPMGGSMTPFPGNWPVTLNNTQTVTFDMKSNQLPFTLRCNYHGVQNVVVNVPPWQ